MNAHRVETVIRRDRTVLLKDLPFQAGANTAASGIPFRMFVY